METDRPALVVWRFLDGKAGHESQSLGLIEALKRRINVKVFDFPVATQHSSFLKWLTRSFEPPGTIRKPDLLIGAGHQTHWPMLAARRACGGKIVVLMRPSLPTSWFDYAIIPEHDNHALRSNVFVTKGVLNSIRSAENASMDKGLILIGGPSKHHSWDDESILNNIVFLMEGNREVDWRLTTSRRTPVLTVQKLQALEYPQLEMIPFEETIPGWVGQQLEVCRRVWVTEDSISMVFEALSAGGLVGLLPVPSKGNGSRVVSAVTSLVQEGWVRTLDKRASTPLAAVPLAEADRVASILIERINLAGGS